MKKQGYFTVPENGYEEIISLGFVPKVVLIEYVAKDDPDVGTVIMRFFIDNTGQQTYWYPQMKSESESKDFGRYDIGATTGQWGYGRIAHFGNYIGFETTTDNDFIGKTFYYYATDEVSGTFTTSSYQYGVVNVNKRPDDKNIVVSLPFGPTNKTTAFYVDIAQEMPTAFSGEVRMSRWSIPSENRIYYIDPDSAPGDQGETGIINSWNNYFIFRSNAGNTQGVSCEYYLLPQVYDHVIEESDNDYFIYNIISNSTSISDAEHKYFYKYKVAGKIALYEKPNERGYDLILKGVNNIDQILYSTSAEGDYNEVSDTATQFLRKSQVWSNGDKWYPLTFRTNIPIFAADDNHTAEENAQRFIDGDITEEDAVNYDQLKQEENWKVDGQIGDKITGTTTGVSDLSFTSGVQVYALTNLQKASFFNKIFDTTVTPIEDLLEGTQLFGANEIGAIQGLHYVPFDASEVCTMGSSRYINIGSYRVDMGADIATCLKNNKYISCGSAVFNRTYGDYRDYEPYCQLYIALPYAGTHKLQLSKYLDKSISVHYCVDITTGALMVRVFADGVLMDTFDGQCASHLPITAVDHAQQTNAVLTGLINTAGSTIDTVGSVAGVAANAATIGANAMSSQTSGAIGNIIGAAGNIAGGMPAVISPIINGYATMQHEMSAPVTTRGGYSGNLGNFGLTHPTFIFAWLNTVVPENEISLVGKPSNKGGNVGSFAGFLQCAAFTLADGFNGTDTECAEIYDIMSKGIYVS